MATLQPVVAGAFYPGDAPTLTETVDSYLQAVKLDSPLVGRIFGLVSPHAGYQYSGATAAYSYARIKGQDYRTVVVLAPSHRAAFSGVSIYPSGALKTPLGEIPVDAEACRKLMARCDFVKHVPQAFASEHSLEVQLPFLQRSLAGFQLVPLVMGELPPGGYQRLADALQELLDSDPGRVLIVASSDMSHYHPDREARPMDQRTLKLIEAQKLEELADCLNSGKGELCGGAPVITLLLVAKGQNATARILKYATSGDATGDRARVVGYGAVAFSAAVAPATGEDLAAAEQRQLIRIARTTLDEYIRHRRRPAVEAAEPRLREKRGVFVTLTKHGELRGCIGFIKGVKPLAEAVAEMAVNAAVNDHRFQPVEEAELGDIRVEISVLTPLVLVSDVNEIQVGRHGLYISRGFEGSGLLLPQVATDYGWNREQFLQQTCRKANLPLDAWKRPGTEIYRFSAQIFHEE